MKWFTPVWSFLLKIWKDSVWSNVISVGIIFLIGLVGAKVTNHSWSEIYSFIIKVLSFQAPIYLFLSAIALYFVARLIVNLVKKRKDPFWDEQMGNYTFKELHNILLLNKWPVQTAGMAMVGKKAPEDDLMFLFRLYYPILTKGVDFYDNVDDAQYLYGALAPKLVGFGLVEAYDKPNENLPGRTNIAYRVSEVGHRFHAKMDKIALKQQMKEERTKKRT
jgi:hypothetical protein